MRTKTSYIAIMGPEEIKIIVAAVGSLAEHAAEDLDHYGKNHAKWYRAVKRARKLLGVKVVRGIAEKGKEA